MGNERVRIGLFIDSYFPMIDGVVMVVHNYAKRLSKVADVTVFCPQYDKNHDDSIYEYKIVRSTKTTPLPLTDYKIPFPGFDKKFKKQLEESNLDLVHIHSGFGIGKFGIKYAKEHNIPVIATLHSQHKRDIYDRTHSKIFTNAVMRKLIKTLDKADEKYAVNDKIADLYVEYGLKQKPFVLSNATDMHYKEDQSGVEALRGQYNIKEGQKVLLFVGRIDKIKNIPFILKVLKVLKEKNFDFKMLFVGGGAYLETLEKNIVENQIDDRVVLVGKVYDRDKLADYFGLANLHVFPSDYDASSLVQIEAASQKTPTIFAKGSITASTITEDVNGFAEVLDENKFADKIISIFADDKKYQQVCQKAFEEVYVNWDDKVDEVFAHYLELIKANKAKKNSKLISE